MKKILLLFAFLPVLAIAQFPEYMNLPSKDGKIIYTDVVRVDSSLTDNQLYLNAKSWLAENFKSSKAVIQTDDKDAKLIIAKSFLEVSHLKVGEVSNPKEWFLLKLEMKNGRYRYAIYDIDYEFDIDVMGVHAHSEKSLEEWTAPNFKDGSVNQKLKALEALNKFTTSINDQFNLIIASLKDGMSKKPESNW